MLTIKSLVNEKDCSFCLKPKEGCIVEFADQKSGESVLCWACLKKMAQMKHRALVPVSKSVQTGVTHTSGMSNGTTVTESKGTSHTLGASTGTTSGVSAGSSAAVPMAEAKK